MLLAESLSPFQMLTIKIAFYALGAILLAWGVFAWRRSRNDGVDPSLTWPGVRRKGASTKPKASKSSIFLMLLALGAFALPHTGLLQVDYDSLLQSWRESRRYQAPTESEFYRTDRELNLTQSRENTATNLTRSIPAPQESDAAMAPPPGAKLVAYPSGDLQLKAWVSQDPNDQKKRPAIVFLHGGFALDETDWEVLQPFRDAGFVVMTPSLRGENGNPGYFEFFYGEVDDAIAAGSYLAKLPYVDEDKVYVTGHSIGGKLVAMVGVSDSNYRAAVAYSPSELDTAKWVQDIMRTNQSVSSKKTLLDSELIVFDPRNAADVGLRDPSIFGNQLQIPLLIYYESRRQFSGGTFESKAEQGNRPLLNRLVTGVDHMTMLPKAIDESLPWLQFMSMVDTSQITRSNIKEYWNKQSLDVFAATSEFGKQTLDLKAFASLSAGMTKEKTLEVMGPEGHFGAEDRSPKLLELLRDRTATVSRKTWTHDSGTRIYTGFNSGETLVSLGLSGDDSVFAAKYRELQELIDLANVTKVETILDEDTFAVVDDQFSYLVWTSDGQILAARFNEKGELEKLITEPHMRLTRKNRQ